MEQKKEQETDGSREQNYFLMQEQPDLLSIGL